MRYEIPFLLVCSVTVLQCMGSSRRDAQVTNLKAPRDDSYSVLESGSTLEVGQGDDGRICETLLNFKEVCHFSRRSSPPSSFCPGYVTPSAVQLHLSDQAHQPAAPQLRPT